VCGQHQGNKQIKYEGILILNFNYSFNINFMPDIIIQTSNIPYLFFMFRLNVIRTINRSTNQPHILIVIKLALPKGPGPRLMIRLIFTHTQFSLNPVFSVIFRQIYPYYIPASSRIGEPKDVDLIINNIIADYTALNGLFIYRCDF